VGILLNLLSEWASRSCNSFFQRDNRCKFGSGWRISRFHKYDKPNL